MAAPQHHEIDIHGEAMHELGAARDFADMAKVYLGGMFQDRDEISGEFGREILEKATRACELLHEIVEQLGAEDY